MSTLTEHQSYPPIEVDIRIRPREESQRIEPPASYWPQIFAGISATLGGLVMGTCIGWSGPALHLLVTNTSEPFDNPNHEFPVSEEQGSLIASLLPCGALFGGILKFVRFSIFNFVHFLILSNFQICPIFQFCPFFNFIQFSILSNF